MAYLNNEEFTEPERKAKLGTINWPDWHYGVLSMYGAHMALNHLLGSNEINLIKLPDLIDFPSMNSLDVNTVLHIHVYHGEEMFSKFLFKMGYYNNMTVNHTLWNQIKYYSLNIALESKQKTEENLHQMLKDQNNRKN